MSVTGNFEEPRRLADFLRENRNQILEAWLRAVGEVRSARNLERPLLLDHMPAFVDELADYVDELRHGAHAQAPRDNPRMHALERLSEGYDLPEVVDEYAIFRRCIADLVTQSGAPAMRSIELPLLHRAIDQAITTAVMRYAEARERTLRALDRISSTALEHHEIESLLPKLLDAFLETTASVDSVALSLREEGVLRVRAAVGFPPPGPVGHEVPPGGFSSIVEQKGPRSVRDAQADPALVLSPTCAPGTHAMYGTQLKVGEEILGVVAMGSRSGLEFSQEDELLFRTMVSRAATLIAHARLHAEVVRQTAELRAVIEFRERMLGVLSHDLRNPLQVILASAYSLQRSTLDETQSRSAARVTSSARRIDRMIRDLLDYTRARRERGLPLSRSEADLAEICRLAIDGLSLLHPQRTLRLHAAGVARGSFDPDRAAQVVGNLVDNALHYSPPDTPIDVTVSASDGELLLEVHNQGPSISRDLLPHIFDAFQRGGTESGSEGLGLGLYIVKAIVQAHGGSIEVRSSEGEGTTFSVRWPKR